MKEVLTKINDLYSVLETRVAKLEAEKSEIESIKANAKTKLSDVKSREEQLVKDEDRVKKFKTILEAEALIADETKKLKALKASVQKEITAKKEGIKGREEILELAEKELERKQTKLAKDFKKLDMEKQNYKKQVFDEVIRETKALNKMAG